MASLTLSRERRVNYIYTLTHISINTKWNVEMQKEHFKGVKREKVVLLGKGKFLSQSIIFF